MSTGRERKVQAEVSGRAIDLVVAGDQAHIDGRAMPFSAERLSATHLSLILDGRSYSAVVIEEAGGRYRVALAGSEYEVHVKDERDLLLERYGLAEASAGGVQTVRAPMPGLVLSVAVEPGQKVEKGAGLAVLEAMKMENELRAEHGGTVKAVHVAPGDAVGKSDLLLEIE